MIVSVENEENGLANVVLITTGVFMMASASQIWRATGGRFNSSYFQYKIGGEW